MRGKNTPKPNNDTTMSRNKDLRKAKHEAYEKKQAEKGEKVINCVIGVLLVLAIAFMVYTCLNA